MYIEVVCNIVTRALVVMMELEGELLETSLRTKHANFRFKGKRSLCSFVHTNLNLNQIPLGQAWYEKSEYTSQETRKR